jgi:hypothetical protein
MARLRYNRTVEGNTSSFSLWHSFIPASQLVDSLCKSRRDYLSTIS